MKQQFPETDPGGRTLSVVNHDRDSAAMDYVYPVISRRAGGVSLGINLNVNNACNWACVYCQVPNLVRGGPPEIDLVKLDQELDQMLGDLLDGDFMATRVPEGMRRLCDVAFSGNGEPTSSEQFGPAVDVVLAALARRDLAGNLPVRVITNGSLMHRPAVQAAMRRLAAQQGEIWFKIDRATESGALAVNQTAIRLDQVQRNLELASAAAPVWIQTCWFGIDGTPPEAQETDAYVALVAANRQRIRGVHLYGIARPSMQPEAARLQRLPRETLEALAARLKNIGVTATVSE